MLRFHSGYGAARVALPESEAPGQGAAPRPCPSFPSRAPRSRSLLGKPSGPLWRAPGRACPDLRSSAHRDSAHATSSPEPGVLPCFDSCRGPASPQERGGWAACARLCSTEVVFGLAGRRVVDCIKVAAKGEPKDEVFQGERAGAL